MEKLHPFKNKECCYCGREYSEEFIKQKKEDQAKRVKQSLADRKAKGLPIGRPKNRPDKDIIRLRKEGLTMREIALKLSCSIGSVQRSLNDAGL